MLSQTSLLVCGTFIIILIISIESAPIEKPKQIPFLPPVIDSKPEKNGKDSNLISTTIQTETSSTANVFNENLNQKTKRNIDDTDVDEILNSLTDDDGNSDETREHLLHTRIRETSAQIHDNGQHSTEFDDSNVFSDIKMNPSELKTIGRERRDLHLNDHDNRRRKRAAFSPYDFYDTDEIYDPWSDFVEEDTYFRPSRSLGPIYWFPPVSKRSFVPSNDYFVEETPEWIPKYSIVTENDDDDDDEVPDFLVDDEDEDENDENDDENSRYPILIDLTKNPFDNLQLQQNYNGDEIPIDESENEISDEQENDDDDQLEQYPIAYEAENPDDFPYEPLERFIFV